MCFTGAAWNISRTTRPHRAHKITRKVMTEMTNKHPMPAANSIKQGAQSVFKTRPARNRSAGTLRLVSENEGSAEYGRLPIWMAALVTSGCRATAAGSDCNVQWHCINGRAQYTNDASGARVIQP